MPNVLNNSEETSVAGSEWLSGRVVVGEVKDEGPYHMDWCKVSDFECRVKPVEFLNDMIWYSFFHFVFLLPFNFIMNIFRHIEKSE